MELRRAADALLRCPKSPLTQCLNSATSARRTGGSQLSSSRLLPKSSQRTIVTSNRKPGTQANSTASAAGSSLFDKAPTIPSHYTRSSNNRSSQLGWLNPKSEAQQRIIPRRKSPVASTNKSDDAYLNILDHLNPSALKPGLTANAWDNFNGSLDASQLVQELTNVPRALPMRLTPSTGRQVDVMGMVDVGRAFRLLDISCAKNKVRADFTKQRFHERGGLKRKRLRRERWRTAFMAGFRATVSRVKQLQKQGW